MASSSSGRWGLRSKAPPPGRSEWQRETALRLDKRERRGEERGPERFPLREGEEMRKLLRDESRKLAAAVLELGAGMGREAAALGADFPELAVSVAKYQRERLALKPARFEPQEGTRIIEGRPVQALPRSSLQPCPVVWKRRCGRVWRAGGGGGRSARGAWAGSASAVLYLTATDIRWPSPSPATCDPHSEAPSPSPVPCW